MDCSVRTLVLLLRNLIQTADRVQTCWIDPCKTSGLLIGVLRLISIPCLHQMPLKCQHPRQRMTLFLFLPLQYLHQNKLSLPLQKHKPHCQNPSRGSAKCDQAGQLKEVTQNGQKLLLHLPPPLLLDLKQKTMLLRLLVYQILAVSKHASRRCLNSLQCPYGTLKFTSIRVFNLLVESYCMVPQVVAKPYWRMPWPVWVASWSKMILAEKISGTWCTLYQYFCTLCCLRHVGGIRENASRYLRRGKGDLIVSSSFINRVFIILLAHSTMPVIHRRDWCYYPQTWKRTERNGEANCCTISNLHGWYAWIF